MMSENKWNSVYNNRRKRNKQAAENKTDTKATKTFERKPYDVLGYLQKKYGIKEEQNNE